MKPFILLLFACFPYFGIGESESLSHTGCGIIPASPTIINGSPASFPWMSQDDPLNSSSTKNDQVDSDNKNMGESNMIKEKVIKNP